MRVLLTGGYGCIGSWIARALLQHPLSNGTRQTLRAALAGGDEPLPDGERRRVDPRMVAGLLLGSPEFQRR